jgi:hypothetical protein
MTLTETKMASINNDHELRLALDSLTAEQQRLIGGQFVKSVLGLCDDSRVRNAVAAATNEAAVSQELEEAFRNAKAVSVKTYTDCGKDTDWLAQAAHFVAAAATAALSPAQQKGDNPAWKAAMQARMARNCEMIERQDGEDSGESETQYKLTQDFIA